MRKRILALLLAAAMILGTAPVDGLAAEIPAAETGAVTDGLEYATGLLPLVGEELTLEGDPACGAWEGSTKRAACEWDRYANLYYYNQMNEAEQAFYDRLDAVAYGYLTSEEDIQGVQSKYSDYISYAGVNTQEAIEILLLFRYANPQYYFITNEYGYTSENLVFGIYPAFRGGASRKAATARFQTSLETAVDSVMAAGTDPEEKAQAAHDWIINKVQYNQTYIELQNDPDVLQKYELSEGYTQSAYSTFCLDRTVCAGYTQAFSALCNAVDVETLGVTSRAHAWNKVLLFGNWYLVDCTWDDPVSSDGKAYLFYDFFDRSAASVAEEDPNAYHMEEECYRTYDSPACKYDSVGTETGGNRLTPGKIPETYKAVEKTAAPTLAVTVHGGDTNIHLSCPASQTAAYYYTLDGTIPSVSGSKSHRARDGVISYSGNRTVKVIAKADGYLESDVSSYSTVLPSCTVSFQTNQGTPVSPQTVTAGERLMIPADPVRKGYTFEGWYTDNSFRTPWDFSGGRVTGNLTLYAKWASVTYRITYVLNKGKNSRSNPDTYTAASKNIVLKSPARNGYRFQGWYSDSKYKKRVTKLTAGSTGSRKFYAKWAKITAPKKTAVSRLVNKKGRKLQVSIKKVSGAAGYQVRYSVKASMRAAKTVTTASRTPVISGLKKGKTYYVQVRAYKLDSAGKKVPGGWSARKMIRIRR